jgi:hypothetical protein
VKFESDMSFTPKNMSEFFTDETLDSWKKLMPGTVTAHLTYCFIGNADFRKPVRDLVRPANHSRRLL